MSKTNLVVEGSLVAIETVGDSDFISLTDIAKRESRSGGQRLDRRVAPQRLDASFS